MESINQLKIQATEVNRNSKALLAYTAITVMVSMLMTTAKAQTFAEWFSQKKTQKKYLLEQIAALQVYSKYMQQGYKIAKTGLGGIAGSLKTEYDLHNTYYTNLKTVSPVIKNNQQVKDILSWQQDILTEAAKLNNVTALPDGQRIYLQKVKSALLNDCKLRIDDLQNIVTNGKLQMADKERLARLNELHNAMQDNYRFAHAFTGQVQVYLTQKKKEEGELDGRKKILGIY